MARTVDVKTIENKVDIIDWYQDVPSANSTDNAQVRDVIWNKTDNSFSNNLNTDEISLMWYNKAWYYHIHSPAQLYPVLDDPITVTASANAWTDYGSWVEIIPANTITNTFDIHWVDIYDISANGNYVLQLWAWASGSEVVIWTVWFGRNAVQSQEWNVPIQIPPQPANNRIAARLSSSNANDDTCDVKLYYHEYLN